MAFEECYSYGKFTQVGPCRVVNAKRGQPDDEDACRHLLIDACVSGYDTSR